MIDRGGVTPNRMESHFFWPDDTKAESAVETRLRRRNSVQLQDNDKPLYGRQNSVGGNDVDTKRRFSKEFSQSSIQFYDDINDNGSTSNRKPLRSGASKRSELTEKPTATRLELPEAIVDEAYTSAKRKQAYTSKIQFYDFVNEDDARKRNSQNNLRKPKMDMNDKREMELNSKNSPKLQVKRDVRSLSEEKEVNKINNRDTKTLERPRQKKEVNVNRTYSMKDNTREDAYRRSNVSPKRSTDNDARRSYDRQRHANERDIVVEHDEEMPKRNPVRSESYQKPRYSDSNTVLSTKTDYRDYDRESEIYENRRYSNRRYVEDPIDEEPQYRDVRNDTKKISGSEYNYEEDIGNRMKTVRIQSSPPRKHHYYREEYYDDEDYNRSSTPPPSREPIKLGNNQKRSDYRTNQRYDGDDLPYEENTDVMNNNSRHRNSDSSVTDKMQINRVTNKLNNNVADPGRDTSPPPGPSPSAASEAAQTDVNKPRKHLRSSLCFHDGAIVAENDATMSPTSDKPAARRNIRNMATKRVSVGLPD